MQTDLTIVTAVMSRYDEDFDNNNPYNAETPYILPYSAVIEELKYLIDLNREADLLVLPGGLFYFDEYKPKEILSMFEEDLSGYLKEIDTLLVLAFGFDSEQDVGNTGMTRHEMGLALDQSGILALARKFHPIDKTEEAVLIKAPDYLYKEEDFPRTFRIKDQSFYLAICYDCFGPSHLGLKNPGVDAAITLVHNFIKRSGYVDFARKGFAGLSKTWDIPVFASARFMNMNIPSKWPTGLYNSAPEKSTLYFKYSDNSLAPVSEPLTLETKLGKVRLSEYHLKNKELEKRDD